MSTTTIMTNTNQRNQILETLDELDQQQTEKVLAFMKSFLQQDPHKIQYKRFKREAMREIRQAITQDRIMNSRG
jgi:hypothetical protein